MEKSEYNDVICPLCHNNYDDSYYTPRMLPECGHTFCSSCLKSLLNQSSKGLICPEDKTEYPNKKSILAFPKNFALLQIINRQKFQNKQNCLSPTNLQTPPHKLNSSLNNDKQDNLDRFRQELNKPNFESVCNDLSFNKSNFNNENLNKINISDKEQEKICRSHNKKMDLFCIEDNERICTNCALFGDHKNHEIEEEEEILKKINAKAENILTILEKLEIYDEKQISSLAELGKLFEECIFKRDNIMNLIQEKFKELNKILNKLEENITSKINDFFNRLQTVLACLNKIPITEILSGFVTWQIDAKNKLLILSQKTEKDEICFEILAGGCDQIEEGKKLAKRLEKLNEIPMKVLQQTLTDTKLNFNELLLKSLETNLYQIHLPNLWERINIDVLFNDLMESTEEFQSKKDLISITEIFPEKKSHSILMDMSKMPTSIDNLAKSPMRGPIKFNPRSQNEYNPNGYLSLNQNDLSYDSVKTVKRNLSSQNVKIDGVNVKNNEPRAFSGYYSFSKNLRKNSEHQEAIVKDKDLSGELTPQITGLKKNSNFERNIMKKQSMMVRLKMPEKYKVIFEDLKNDKLENVDLSNAELGDKAITHLADLLADAQNVKVLKLKKNKISDEGFSVLLEAFRKNESIKTMSFEYNQLTEKSIEAFCKMLFLKKNGLVIKKASFLNNNINTSKCKSYIKEAKGNNVDLYL